MIPTMDSTMEFQAGDVFFIEDALGSFQVAEVDHSALTISHNCGGNVTESWDAFFDRSPRRQAAPRPVPGPESVTRDRAE